MSLFKQLHDLQRALLLLESRLGKSLSRGALIHSLESLASAQKCLWVASQQGPEQEFRPALGDLHSRLTSLACGSSIGLRAFRATDFQAPKTLEQALRFLQRKAAEHSAESLGKRQPNKTTLHGVGRNAGKKCSDQTNLLRELLADRKVVLVTSRQSAASRLAAGLGIIVQSQPRHGAPSICNHRLQTADIVIHDTTCTSHLKRQVLGRLILLPTPITNRKRFIQFLLCELPSGESAA